MPLPIKDSVVFRGVPSLGAEKKMALSMTLTQKQVEAMFARQSALRELGSTSYPLEIDFDENKIYIGDIATPFTRYKEDGTREICQRSPTASKPLAPISLSGNVIGKLSIFRDFDQDIADNVRKATEAQHSKRNERTIVVLDKPPVISKTKKSKSGSGASSLAKKAMSNRLVSAQATASRPSASATASRTSTPTTSSSAMSTPKPSMSASQPTSSRSVSTSVLSSSSSSSASKEPDLTSLRARLTHLLALDPRTTQQVLVDVGGRSPSPETVREIEDTLTAVAQEIQPPKKGPPGPVKWELQWRSWEQVRPYEWPDLTSDQRTRMARKGRLAFGQMNLPSTDPLWEHFKTRTSDASALPPPTKTKTNAVTSGPTVLKNTEFRGGMFPKEKKPSTKGGGVASGGITKSKASTAKAKSKKDQEDEVETKVRKALTVDTKEKDRVTAASSNISSIPAARIPKKKKQEEEAILPNSKARSSMGSIKKESPPASKPIRVHGEGSNKRKHPDMEIDGSSEMEEGEVIVEPDIKRRKSSGIGESVKSKITQNGSRDPSLKKNTKEQMRVPVKEESVPLKLGKDVATSRVNGTSSKSVSVGSKAQRLEEKEPGVRDADRLSEREREKRRSNGKRGRRATPSFSSDEEEEEEPKKPSTPVRTPVVAASKSKPSHPPSSKLASHTSKAGPSRAPAPSPVLPTDKDALRRRYHMCYARYMGVTSKVYEQLAKVETLLAPDADTDDEVEMMETEELVLLRGEHDRLRDELQRILHAHASAF